MTSPKKKGKQFVLGEGYAYIGCDSNEEPIAITLETVSCEAGEPIPFSGRVDLVHGRKIRLIAEVIQ